MQVSRSLAMMLMLANAVMAWADLQPTNVQQPAVFNLIKASLGTDTAEDTGDMEDTRNSLPPIHIRQSVEMNYQGVNEARANYLAALRDCQASGLHSRALPDQDVALLGTTRYELWFARDIEVIRETSWRVANDGPGGTCLFRLDTTGTQGTTTATSYQRVDLATGEKTKEVAAPEALSRTPV